MVNYFSLVKKHNILCSSDHTILFKFHQHVVQILIKECMKRLWSSDVSISNGNIKYPIGTSIFAVNLTLKLLRVTVAGADIGSLKSLHTFLKKYLYHMLVKFEQNRQYNRMRFIHPIESNTSFVCTHLYNWVPNVVAYTTTRAWSKTDGKVCLPSINTLLMFNLCK